MMKKRWDFKKNGILRAGGKGGKHEHVFFLGANDFFCNREMNYFGVTNQKSSPQKYVNKLTDL